RPYPPGQHGQRRSKFTEYGIRLREKQKVRRMYGLAEKQFRGYFHKADASKGVTGEEFLGLLERRLDSFVYRAGFASTRSDARQLVLHRHVHVNGKGVNIPSYILKPGDVVSVKEKSRTKGRVVAALELMDRRGNPEWLEVDKTNFTATVKTLPNREEITLPIQEQLIVEFYSR
ncbi:MAG: 30S ribosomal protein S4, partial [Myxococcales bacterium]|nr:30S ribosomal protein S4 [Myxococcales bacterium]